MPKPVGSCKLCLKLEDTPLHCFHECNLCLSLNKMLAVSSDCKWYIRMSTYIYVGDGSVWSETIGRLS